MLGDAIDGVGGKPGKLRVVRSPHGHKGIELHKEVGTTSWRVKVFELAERIGEERQALVYKGSAKPPAHIQPGHVDPLETLYRRAHEGLVRR